MALRTIEVALRANTAAFSTQMGTAAASVRGFGNQVETVAARNSAQLQALGKVGMAMGAAVLAGAGLSVAAAIKYESAFAGVAKTVDGTAQQMAQLSAGIRGMARELPASTTEIAAVAEAAGALGVKREDILGFTRVMIDLGETTNLSADQAATSLAQMSNIMGTAGADIDRLGSTLVHLGNNGASTEAEILELAQRLAGAGNQAGLSEADVLGFANALASMGINAEAGGTAFSRVFVKINDAVIDGGEKLDVFAGLAGMSAEKFRTAYEQDAAGAITMFIGGLGRMMDSGQSTTAVLEDLELGEIRVSDALRRTAGNTDVLTNSLQQGREAWDENSALAEEAQKRYQTTGAQLEILRNNVVDLAIGFGDKLLPAVRFMADGTKSLLQGFQAMPGPMQGIVAVTGSLMGLLAGAAGTALVFGDRIRGGIQAIHAFADAFPRLSSALGIGAISVGVVGTGIMFLAQQMGESKARAEELWKAFEAGVDMSSLSGISTGISEAQHRLADLEAQVGIGTGAWAAFGSTLKGTIEFFTPMADTVADTYDEIDEGRSVIDRLTVAQVHLSENSQQLATDLGLTREEVERLAKKTGIDLRGAYHEVVPALKAAHDEMTTGLSASEKTYLSLEEQEAAAKVLKETYEGLTEAMAGFVNPMDAYNTVMEGNKATAEEWAEGQNAALEKTKVSWKDYPGLVKEGLKGEALEANKEKAREWAEEQNESVKSAQKTWEDFPEGVKVSLTQYADQLTEQIKAQDEFRTNLLLIAARNRGDVARELAEMARQDPMAAAALAQEFVNTVGPEFDRAGNVLVESARRRMEDVGVAVDSEFKIIDEIAKQGANGTVQSVADALANLPGVSEELVRETARRAGKVLDEEKPSWDRRWADRSEAARREMAGVRRDVPPLAGAAAEESEREVARRGGSWGSRWWERYWGARVPTDAMRRDVPPVVGATGGAMSDLLAGGLPRFQQTVGGYAGSLEGGIRTVAIAAAARAAANLRPFAEGGIVDFYANGGLKESHQAQIARAGDWRVWAEPETGGEAYIPLSPNKRDRSVPIWLETGRRLGLDEDSLDALRGVMAFHEGGLVEFPRRPDLPHHGPPIRPRGEATMDNMLAFAREVAKEHMKLPHHQLGIGGDLGGGMGWQWQMAVLRERFPGLPLYSGFRPGAITATGNPSWHGKGRAVDIPPRLDVNKWIAQTYGAGTKELILTAPGATQIKNGRPHVYTGITRAMHKDHNHWAYKLGGILDGFTERFNGIRSYDSGGYLPPGYTLAHNGTGQPEPVGLGDFSEATNQASRVGEEVLDALLSGVEFRAGGVPQTFSEVGGGIAQGMAGGLRAGVPDVWSAMSIFSEAMPAKVKEQLGIESPSAVFHGYGHSVALGYANGIRAGIPAAQGAYADLMRASGMVQAEDGSWVPRSFYSKPRHIHPRPRHTHAAPPNDDSFASNSYYSRNRGKPGAIQAEDGSWVMPSFYARRSYDSGGWLEPGYTLAYNGTGRREAVIPTPMGPGASSGGTTVVNNIQATYELNVEGDITDRTVRVLRSLFDEHDRELARMVRAGTH